MNRKSDAISLKTAIGDFLEDTGIGNKFDEAKIKQLWKESMGMAVANRTANLYVKQGILYLKIESSALRNKLFYDREKIIVLLNSKIGKKIIKEVVVR